MSGSTYEGTAATVTVGQTLAGGGTAVANGTYPNVFENATDRTGIVTSFSSKSELALNLSTSGSA